MIIGVLFKKEKFVLNTESPTDASMVKSGLAGKNTYASSSPFGNRINISTETNSILFAKQSGNPFTYEEVHGIIKKIELLGKISRIDEDNILKSARSDLDSKTTLFFPDIVKPRVEASFKYNWLTLRFESPKFKDISVEIAELIEKANPSVKVNTGKFNDITLHNYKLDGLYLGKETLAGLATILEKGGVINSEEKKRFIIRMVACCVRSLVYMEARIIAHNDETFDFDNEATYNPTLGNRKFLSQFQKVLLWLSQKGIFIGLNKEQIDVLAVSAADIDKLKEYSLAKPIREIITQFCMEYKEEIAAAKDATG